MNFKFFNNNIHPDLPDNHYIIDMGPVMCDPATFGSIRIVYHKHINPNIKQVYKMIIHEGHDLWDWNQHRISLDVLSD